MRTGEPARGGDGAGCDGAGVVTPVVMELVGQQRPACPPQLSPFSPPLPLPCLSGLCLSLCFPHSSSSSRLKFADGISLTLPWALAACP